MASNWYRLMRTLGRSPDIVNQNTLPSQPQRREAGPVVTLLRHALGSAVRRGGSPSR